MTKSRTWPASLPSVLINCEGDLRELSSDQDKLSGLKAEKENYIIQRYNGVSLYYNPGSLMLKYSLVKLGYGPTQLYFSQHTGRFSYLRTLLEPCMCR